MFKANALNGVPSRGVRLAFFHEGREVEGVVTHVDHGGDVIALTVEAFDGIYEVVIDSKHIHVLQVPALQAA